MFWRIRATLLSYPFLANENACACGVLVVFTVLLSYCFNTECVVTHRLLRCVATPRFRKGSCAEHIATSRFRDGLLHAALRGNSAL